jgi:hypothetical protein
MATASLDAASLEEGFIKEMDFLGSHVLCLQETRQPRSDALGSVVPVFALANRAANVCHDHLTDSTCVGDPMKWPESLGT